MRPGQLRHFHRACENQRDRNRGFLSPGKTLKKPWTR